MRSEYNPTFPASWTSAMINSAREVWGKQARNILADAERSRIRSKHEKCRVKIATTRKSREKFDEAVTNYYEGL